jgi:hypothetical protein
LELRFLVTPKETNGLLWKPNTVRGPMKQNTAASTFPATALLESKALKLCWRLRYYKKENMLAPAKPLWFLSAPVVLQPFQCVRLV